MKHFYGVQFLNKSVRSGLLNNCKKMFLLLTETTDEILQTTLRSYLKVKMFHWYKMNSKVFLYNTALSAQLPCIASHSL